MRCFQLNAFFFCVIFSVTGQQQNQCDKMMDRFEWQKDLIPKVNGEKHYWKSTPPQVNESVPVEVRLNLIPTSIRKISLSEQTIEIQYILLVFWEDCRLNIPVVQRSVFPIVASDVAKDLWVPTFEYRNCLKEEPIVFDERIHPVFVLDNTTLGYYSRRVVTVHCAYNLTSYPMDTQHCKLQIQQGAPKSVIVIKLHENMKELTKAKSNIVPPEYQLKELKMAECAEIYLSQVDFSCVELYIVFSRQMTFHLGVTFLPSILIVILSSISFWMDAEAAAPRITLGLTSMLTLVTTYVNAQKDLPAVSYLKAVDVYMFACVFLVFTSLVEFSFANYLARNAKTAQKILPVATLETRPGEKKNPIEQHGKKMGNGSTLDKRSRIIFPIVFIAFNIVYWSYFLH